MRTRCERPLGCSTRRPQPGCDHGGVNLDQVVAFLALAEELHFGRTAERTVMSQTRVSRLIASLEAEVGGRLFDRTSRRVRLTPLGEGLRGHLAAGYEHLREGMESAMIAARAVEGAVRVGFTPTIDPRRVREAVQAFGAGHPACEVLALEVPVNDRYESLRRGDVDVLLTWLALDEPDLTAGPALSSEPRVLIVAASHPLAGRASISIEEVAGLPAMDVGGMPRRLADTLVPPRTPAGRALDRLVPPDSITTVAEVLALVHQDRIVHPSVASVARSFSTEGLAFVPIADLPPLPCGPVWVTAHENARIRAFAATVRATSSGQPVGTPDG